MTSRRPDERLVLVTAALSGGRQDRWTWRRALGHDAQGREVVAYYQRYFAIERRSAQSWGGSATWETVARATTFTRIPGGR